MNNDRHSIHNRSNEVTESCEEPEIDLTGRDRMAKNVLASWAGHFVFLIAGFILPRLMDRSLGQAALGVWDFAWSVVAYFGLVHAGIGSSVSRYVAQYRAKGDVEGLRCAVSSVWCVLLVAAVLIAALSVATSALIPRIAGDRLGAFASEAGWVVLLLGVAMRGTKVLPPNATILRVMLHRARPSRTRSSGHTRCAATSRVSSASTTPPK